jgi:protein-S-isoprenylcysteine O-methyltransferase Ste14
MEKGMTFRRHTDRSDLVGEYVWGDIGQLILLIIFLAVWIVDSFVARYSTFLAAHIPLFLRLVVALGILACSGYLAQSGLRIVFGEIRERPTILHEGVFKVVRHPIYLGSILLFLGLSIATTSIASMIIWIGITCFYHFIARYEEKLLLSRFGAEYEKYMREVPMWIPKLRQGA